ncbi:MAG TPA: hydantoinase B/oxoprolinase family protein, partial [bacterium]
VYRLVDIRTRPGSLVHAKHPAAVAAGWEVAVQICDLLFKALAPAMPEKALACGKGIICNLAFGGTDPRTGRYFTYYETVAGGYGATTRNDGMDAVQAHFQNTENAPVEETEFHYPVRIVRYELINDSEGPGKHRGGMGVRRDYAFPGFAPSYSILSDRAKFAPWGLFGGGDGRAAHYQQIGKGPVRELPSKITFPTRPGDVVSVQTPGAGGVGKPSERDPALVAEDVAQQRISVARAKQVYGVVLNPRTLAVNAVATAALRKRMKAKPKRATLRVVSKRRIVRRRP